jgi:hypothetical protein
MLGRQQSSEITERGGEDRRGGVAPSMFTQHKPARKRIF